MNFFFLNENCSIEITSSNYSFIPKLLYLQIHCSIFNIQLGIILFTTITF